jgi:hypothetical protein
MRISLKTGFAVSIAMLLAATALAGNDTKRGQAGATELLINPWARSSGWAGSNVGMCRGVESMNLNMGGLSNINKTEFMFANTQYLVGTGVQLNAAGLAQRLGETGVLGVSFVGLSMGDFLETTYLLPDGTGNTFTPSMFNLTVGFSKSFTKNISAGIGVRIINQSIPSVNATGAAFDAGVMYTTGDRNQLHLGVSLRNWGPKITYSGDGLAYRATVSQQQNVSFLRTLSGTVEPFDLPSQLYIGAGYDLELGPGNRLTPGFTFVSNSFTKDQLLFGLEYGFREQFMLRAGFNQISGNLATGSERTDAAAGPTFGATLNVPFSRTKAGAVEDGEEGAGVTEASANDRSERKSRPTVGIDYSYRTTNPFNGTHSIGFVLTF